LRTTTSTSASSARTSRVGRGAARARRTAHAALAPRHAQQAAVVHAVEQLRAGVAAEPPNQLRGLAVREVRVDLARVHHAALAHELQHRLRLRPARLRPRRARRARVHQRCVARGRKP
jgi:hypothetical protein